LSRCCSPWVWRPAGLALLLATCLVACGGGDGDSTSSTAGGASTESSASGEEHKGGEASIEEFGSEAGGSDREALLAVFTGYLNAIADKNNATACSYLTTNVQEGLEQFVGGALKGKGCTAILPKLLAPTAPQIAREEVNGQITKVRVEGDRAFIVFKAPGAKLYQLTMVREGGDWKTATVSASVLVPDLSEVTP
jgi:hypothetical protein